MLAELLLGFGPTLLLVGLFVLLARRATAGGGGIGGIGNFGRSQARRADPQKITVTFDDVAGIDEAKAELTEIVDFLQDPRAIRAARRADAARRAAVRTAGTGKTLLARAVAGEAHAAFFSIAASEFIEAIVGVGAARVRDLFAKAKEAAPAIIFIDELDAIGRSRQGSAGITGANDEREQTLDQILTEMDGFESTEAVVVLGATNRPEILDPALLRPGRFDRRVAVQPPDKSRPAEDPRGPHARDPAGQRRRSRCARRLDAGNGRRGPRQPVPTRRRCWRLGATTTRSRWRTSPTRWRRSCSARHAGSCCGPEDRERTAYHESGHALVGMLTPDADPVRKVSIIPRGHGAGGDALDARMPTRLVLARGPRGEDQGRARRAASPRRSSTARSRPAPSQTSSS